MLATAEVRKYCTLATQARQQQLPLVGTSKVGNKNALVQCCCGNSCNTAPCQLNVVVVVAVAVISVGMSVNLQTHRYSDKSV